MCVWIIQLQNAFVENAFVENIGVVSGIVIGLSSINQPLHFC
jgi:hypothetical protein